MIAQYTEQIKCFILSAVDEAGGNMMGQDPNKVAVWQLEFKFATHKIKNGRGTHFLKALDNEPYDQLYERFFMEVDGEMRNVHGDYQFTGCRIRPAIMRDDMPS